MNEHTQGPQPDANLSPLAARRKAMTWDAITRADADRARGQRILRVSAIAAVVAALGIAGTQAFRERSVGKGPSLHPQERLALRGTSLIEVVTGLSTERSLVGIVAAAANSPKVVVLNDEELLAELSDAGIGRSLVRVGDMVRVALLPSEQPPAR